MNELERKDVENYVNYLEVLLKNLRVYLNNDPNSPTDLRGIASQFEAIQRTGGWGQEYTLKLLREKVTLIR